MLSEGTVVKVIGGPGLPDSSLIGAIGRVVGYFKSDPIVNLRVRPTLRKGSCWCIPERCLKVINWDGTEKVGKIARSNYFSCNIKCVKYVSDEEWYFVLIDEYGDIRSKIMKANSNYDMFKWR